MRKKSAKKTSAADLLATPLPRKSPSRSPIESPTKEVEFNLSSVKNNNAAKASASVPPSTKGVGSISDLKDLVSSRLDSIKRQLERSHLEILKDIEASQSRLHKRVKMQTHACQQAMDEAEKEYKKTSERISESHEIVKASYVEFIAEAHASASRVCKTAIPELSKSFEQAIDALRIRYRISST